jgi:hypothetical protein
MAEGQFDPSRSVRFDLGRGQVELAGSVSQLLVPVDAVVQLCRGAGDDALRDFGRRLGTEAARRALESLQNIEQASPEAVLEHLGGQLALLGLGSLGIERWGRALIVTFEHSPVSQEGDELLASVIEGALQRATSRDLRALSLGRDDRFVRLLVLNPGAVDRVRGLLADGISWSDVLAKLNQSRSGGDE